MSATITPRFSDRLFDEHGQLSRNALRAITAAIALLLLMMLTYPLGYDQSTFVVGGDLILRTGAVPYRDFQDVKPPLIFYIYAGALWLFGHHVWSIRAFDVLWTAGTVFYFYRITLRETESPLLAILSTLLLTIRTVGVGYGESAQTESFAVLPMLVVADVTLRFSRYDGRRLWSLAAIAGLATLAMFLLKFTFVLSSVAAILALAFAAWIPLARRVLFAAVALGTFILLAGLYAFYLHAVGALSYFLQAMQWATSYAALDPFFGAQTITKLFYVDFPAKFIHTYTLTGFLIGVLGVGVFLRSLGSGETRNASQIRQRFFFGMMLLEALLGILGVIIERKFFPYHFTRAYWAFAPFLAVGCLALVRLLRGPWRALRAAPPSARIVGLLSVLVLALFLAFYSPIMQLVSQPLYYTVATVRGTAAESVERREDGYPYEQMKQLGTELREQMKPNDKLFFWGMDATLYFFADRVPVTNEVIPTPYTAAWAPKNWKDDIIRKLEAARPEYFVVEWGDKTYLVTRTNKDSYQHLMSWPALRDYLLSNYHESFREGRFIVYRLNGAPQEAR